MAKTRHIATRMNQRGIENQLIELATQFGITQARGPIAKKVLGKKGVDACLKELDQLRSKFVKLRDKGGIVVVQDIDESTAITTYRLDSFDPKVKH